MSGPQVGGPRRPTDDGSTHQATRHHGAEDDLLGALRRAWEQDDPPPAYLAERSLFAIGLEDLDAEMAVLLDDALAGAGARSAAAPSEQRGTEEAAHTLTFSSSTLTATVTISQSATGARLDGWLAPAEPLRIEVRRTDLPGAEVFADPGGRFVVDGLAPGLVQLVFHPSGQPGGVLTTPVAAPPVRL